MLTAADDGVGGRVSTFDQAKLRTIGGHFATGVVVVTAPGADGPSGFTAQTFNVLSLDPGLVSFNAGKASSSWPKVDEAGVFCVNVLSAKQEALCRVFATSGADKFDGVGWKPAPGTGSPVLEGSLAWFDCRIQDRFDGGDHIIVVGALVEAELESDGLPLLFYRGGFGTFQA